jgi:hypothetical protein
MRDQELEFVSLGVCIYHHLIIYSDILFCVITCRHNREGCSTYVTSGFWLQYLRLLMKSNI